jgi:hypothetical protein
MEVNVHSWPCEDRLHRRIEMVLRNASPRDIGPDRGPGSSTPPKGHPLDVLKRPMRFATERLWHGPAPPYQHSMGDSSPGE